MEYIALILAFLIGYGIGKVKELREEAKQAVKPILAKIQGTGDRIKVLTKKSPISIEEKTIKELDEREAK